MKVIIAGSREGFYQEIVDYAVVRSGFKITEVVSGGARGVDKMGEVIAEANNLPLKRFPADWNSYGKGAGLIRNRDMAYYADALVAVWDGRSTGTKHMIDYMKKLNKPVFVYIAYEETQSAP